jgi:integrase
LEELVMGRTLNRLKAKQVETLGVGRHGDGGGLYLDRDEQGRSRWIFMWSRNGKRREMGLGSAGRDAVSLAEARDSASKAREIVRAGGDPIEARRAAAAPAAREWTFGEVADEFVRSLSPQWRNEKHRAQWSMTLRTYALPLRALPVQAVDTASVLDVLQPIWLAKPETAARLRGRVERVLDAAKARGLRKGENPARWRGHLDHLLPRRQKLSRGHHAAMAFEHVPQFMANLGKREGVGALALQFLILTAARTGEVLGAKWAEIDLRAGVWTVPASRMKAGREHRVPLSPQAVAILDKVKALRGEGEVQPWVFPRGEPKPLSNMALAMLLRRMKVDDTVHGFRSSFRDWAGEASSFAREIAEAALAHTVGDATERAYRRGDALEKRRELMVAWATYLLRRSHGDNVRPILSSGHLDAA